MTKDEMYKDPAFRQFTSRLDAVIEEARGRGYIEVFIVLSTLKGALLAGQLTNLANKCKAFADKLKEELLSKRPKRKLSWEDD